MTRLMTEMITIVVEDNTGELGRRFTNKFERERERERDLDFEMNRNKP